MGLRRALCRARLTGQPLRSRRCFPAVYAQPGGFPLLFQPATARLGLLIVFPAPFLGLLRPPRPVALPHPSLVRLLLLRCQFGITAAGSRSVFFHRIPRRSRGLAAPCASGSTDRCREPCTTRSSSGHPSAHSPARAAQAASSMKLSIVAVPSAMCAISASASNIITSSEEMHTSQASESMHARLR